VSDGKPDTVQTEARLAERRWVFILGVPVATLLMVALLVELGFHLVPNHYRDLVPWRATGQWHVPGQTYVYYGAFLSPRQPPGVAPNVVQWNRGGWHDADHDPQHPIAGTRILVLGDSYVEGIQVRLDELYHRQLERLLSEKGHVPVEAVAMGASGWGQAHELDALKTQGLGYHPSLVIAEFLAGNDVRNNNADLERLANEQMKRSSWAREWFVDSLNGGLLFPAFLFDRLDLGIRQSRGQQDPVDSDVYRVSPHTPPALWDAAWARTAVLVRDMKGAADRAGAAFLLVVFTSPMEIEAWVPGTPPAPHEMDMRLPARRMLGICAAQQVACLDLAPRFARLPKAEREQVHLAGDGHWSRVGHRLAAEETVKYLTEETRMWPRRDVRVTASSGRDVGRKKDTRTRLPAG